MSLVSGASRAKLVCSKQVLTAEVFRVAKYERHLDVLGLFLDLAF